MNADGGARGNPGPAAIGVVLRDEQGNVLTQFNAAVGITTNNVAEYLALIKGLTLAQQFIPTAVKVIMDSEVVIKQMRGEYSVKAVHLQPLHQQAKAAAQAFSSVAYEHTRRSESMQAQADLLVNQALDAQQNKH